jgi:EAL domain-containing protein (putative c-di-GMP-specific phosphodiesterase class I)
MYIPISVISSGNGKKYGFFHAFFSALIIGPYMPLDIERGVMQEPDNWIIRIFVYIMISFIIGTFSDYSKKNRDKITRMLTHDSVTDLKNIEGMKVENVKDGHNKILFAVTIKDYEEILSFFGYDFTNKAILKFSDKLMEELKGYDAVEIYKYNGMELIVVFKEKEKSLDIKGITKDILKINRTNLMVDNIPIYTEIRIGTAIWQKEENIIECARRAIVSLKQASGNDLKVKNYNKEMDEYYKAMVGIASNFNECLKKGNIKIAYQNIYYAKDETVYGHELLSRWINDDESQIYPKDFIPVIEKTELINELAKFVIDNAFKLLKEASLEGHIVSINFSSKNFNRENIDYLIKQYSHYNVKKHSVQIEITEETLANLEEIKEYIYQIRERGIKIAIDDFGAGYSSYKYLSELPIDVIKLDKSIINRINENKLSFSVVKSIVEVCRDNGIITIAEGVETLEQAFACKKAGVNAMQGYYYHLPQILTN